jgi:tagatose 1,6-diphosphate aldolase
MRRLADDRGFLTMLAVDQRPPIRRLVARARDEPEARPEDVASLKRLLVESLARHASAVLVDPALGYPATADVIDPRRGLLLTLEHDAFEERSGERRSGPIPGWSVEAISRLGADAVKVLAWYRPDASAATRDHQLEWVRSVADDCSRFEIPLVLELLLYDLPGRPVPDEPSHRAGMVIESLSHFAGSGADLFKVESPVPPDALAPLDTADGRGHQRWFSEVDHLLDKPWVVLSAGASPESFRRVLSHACEAGASGYLAGRAIWLDAVSTFPDTEQCRVDLETTAVPIARDLTAITHDRGRPWWDRLDETGSAAGPAT